MRTWNTFLGGCIAALAVPVYAQDMSAEEHFNKAEALFKVREYKEALVHYKAAYLASLAPELLFNMAQCYRFLDQYEEALGSYKTFLRELPQAPNRAEVEGLIKEVEELLAKQKAAQGAAPVGSLKPAGLSNEPASQPITTTPKPEPETKPKPDVTPETKGPTNPKPLLYGAAGGATLGVVFGAISLSTAKKAQESQTAGNPIETFGQQFKTAQTLAAGSDIMLAAALFAGGTGAYMLFKNQQTEATATLGLNQISITFKF
jgi:tetratricopeptide (TPR) repeat protein